MFIGLLFGLKHILWEHYIQYIQCAIGGTDIIVAYTLSRRCDADVMFFMRDGKC